MSRTVTGSVMKAMMLVSLTRTLGTGARTFRNADELQRPSIAGGAAVAGLLAGSDGFGGGGAAGTVAADTASAATVAGGSEWGANTPKQRWRWTRGGCRTAAL